MSPIEIYVDGHIKIASVNGRPFKTEIPTLSGSKIVYLGDRLGQGDIRAENQNQSFELTQTGQAAEIEVTERASYLFTMASVPRRRITVKRI